MSADDRSAVEQFYAEQIHALDRGDLTTYGETFGTDAEFVIDGRTTLRGRAEIVEHSRVRREIRSARGAVQRHYLANCAITPTENGVRVRGTVLTVESVAGNGARVTGVIDCTDWLRTGGTAGYRVVSRTAKLS
ncbi:MAG TPA: nuclear transport factor 2 family protein [Actinophytocola sp.]|uniref:nuclear transport factor 2 family protein n=1 Tax=Actinophytocola sp. TaxID=1872138 RepID=UPI002DBB38B0|nr:nuclear transport factor 2 family protein [Actinophytocola sp.]HEU5473635.1 nuclear transport factor 2 family protein [Actinophytocola sp.]